MLIFSCEFKLIREYPLPSSSYFHTDGFWGRDEYYTVPLTRAAAPVPEQSNFTVVSAPLLATSEIRFASTATISDVVDRFPTGKSTVNDA
jgi:hypothetical protein